MFFQLHGGPLIQTGGIFRATGVLLLKVLQFGANLSQRLLLACLVIQTILKASLHLKKT